MKWNTWKELGWMEKQSMITAAQAIPAPAPNPDVKPHWVTDDSADGHVRDSADGAGVLTSNDTFGHQRPA